MQQPAIDTSQDWETLICPSLENHWHLGKRKESNQYVLLCPQTQQKLSLTPSQGYALQHFSERYTAGQIQTQVQRQFPDAGPNLVRDLIVQLIDAGIFTLDPIAEEETATRSASPGLKPGVEWHFNPDGYWILRNREDRTFLQVSSQDKAVIEQLGKLPTSVILGEYCLTSDALKRLLQVLAATGMLEGTQAAKPQKQGKFNPLQLLFFKLPLFNPDPWLNRHIDRLRWLWTSRFAFCLIVFLAASVAGGTNQRGEILLLGQRLMQHYGGSLLIPFALLSLLVVTLHELGHAFTLKYYGGDVPEVGLLFMCLFPAAYTDTTDQYCLSRGKRILVVAAGVLVQVTIAAIALLFWNLSVPGSWLFTTSYLLMVGAVFTLAVNLNPLAKFDGYYLAVATSGINNLRSRSFSFYANLLTGQPTRERGKDARILAIYAPFSLLYIWFVFGFLFYRLADWTLLNIPTIAAVLLTIWAIYYFWPANSDR